jgi:hypothetical protein
MGQGVPTLVLWKTGLRQDGPAKGHEWTSYEQDTAGTGPKVSKVAYPPEP